MSKLDDVEQRVAAVEDELPVVREEAAAARALAAGADRDVAEYRSEMRAHTRMLNALRTTQVEHYEALRTTQVEHYEAFGATQVEHYAEHKTDTAELKAEVGEVKAGVALIVRMLEGLGGTKS